VSGVAGDQARVSVRVDAEPAVAFRVFTEEIDQWWRRGPRYRVAGARRGIIRLEPGEGGRLFESIDEPAGARVVESGRVLEWSPPRRLVFEWRASNFAPAEKTEVEVAFEPSGSGTLVTVTHRAWSRIRPDHPARHGLGTVEFIAMIGRWWSDLATSLREYVERR
jgi:uncharacterized protein YndB with AHSA1/START domain